MTDFELNLELELEVANETIREADECVIKLREDYHLLKEHAYALESLLRDHGISYPDFCGW